MGWADVHIAELKAGKRVRFRPRGRSMEPKVCDNQLCTVWPLTEDPNIGDVVLCRVEAHQYLHLVKGTHQAPNGKTLYLIGNNKGGTNGWCERSDIFGVLVAVQP